MYSTLVRLVSISYTSLYYISLSNIYALVKKFMTAWNSLQEQSILPAGTSPTLKAN